MTTLIAPPQGAHLPDRRAAGMRRLPEYEPHRAAGLPEPAPDPRGTPGRACSSGPSSPPGAVHRPAREHVGQLLQLVLEVLNRRRPAAQLRGKLSSAALERLCTALADPYTPRGYRLGRFRLTQPADSAVEVFGTVTRGERTQALAARLDLADGAWVCSSVTVL
jgi:hypothetical protein